MNPAELRAAVERDLGFILAACMPADWTTPAPPEVIGPCAHPDQELKVIGPLQMGQVYCALCRYKMPPDEVQQRVQQAMHRMKKEAQ